MLELNYKKLKSYFNSKKIEINEIAKISEGWRSYRTEKINLQKKSHISYLTLLLFDLRQSGVKKVCISGADFEINELLIK